MLLSGLIVNILYFWIVKCKKEKNQSCCYEANTSKCVSFLTGAVKLEGYHLFDQVWRKQWHTHTHTYKVYINVFCHKKMWIWFSQLDCKASLQIHFCEDLHVLACIVNAAACYWRRRLKPPQCFAGYEKNC